MKIVLFASGGGSNVKAILQAIQSKALDATVSCLVCNVETAGVIEVAKQFNIEVLVIPNKGLSREAHEAEILNQLQFYSWDFWVLAGYMRLFTEKLVKKINQPSYKIINIHPSLLPDFKGVNAYQQAFEAGVEESGCTVHFVNEYLDDGPIIAQASFKRLPNDTLETFMARGLQLEHTLYPKVLEHISKGKVTVLEPALPC